MDPEQTTPWEQSDPGSYCLQPKGKKSSLNCTRVYAADTRGVPKIMSSVLYFAEIVQFMHKTTSCRLSDHWLVTQVNISSTRSLDSVQCTSFHSLFVRLYTK